MKIEFLVSKKEEEEDLEKEWDLIIVGGGPAGLTAGIYARIYTLKTLIISKNFGGLLEDIESIENYPGFVKIKGVELAKKFKDHASHFGCKLLEETVVEIKKEGDTFLVKTNKNRAFESKALIYAVGSSHRKLNVKGENEFLGKGVSYCAVCDAPLFKNKVVAVVGGGDSAVTDAILLTNYAKKVYLIHRRDEFRAMPRNVEMLKKKENVEFLLNSRVKEIVGKDKVEGIKIDKEGEEVYLELDGIFIDVGLIPNTALLKDLNVELENNFVKVNTDFSTNVPGFFAAGDVVQYRGKLRQVVVACGEATIAATSAYKYIRSLKKR